MSRHTPPARARILRTLAQNPGIHAGRLARKVGLSWNGTAHHLRKLRSAGAVSTIRVSNRRLYFLPHDEETTRVAARLTSSAARLVARHVCEFPGENVRSVASATGLSRRVVYHHAKRLRDVGALRTEGEPLRFHPTAVLTRFVQIS